MKEQDVRPKEIFDEYLRLTEQDTETYFSSAKRERIACPACGQTSRLAFEKHGFSYELCNNCDTLFVNPRPEARSFEKYYTESPSAKYWASTFYKETESARRELLWKPKAKNILRLMKDNDLLGATVVDVGGGYGIFGEEISQLVPNDPIIIEPNPALAEICRQKGLRVVESFLEQIDSTDLDSNRKVFVSFELFEHLHDPSKFIKHLSSVMRSGDFFAFTTLSGVGLDIKLLWEKSKSVSPPHHLNFFNPKSASMLLESLGFSPVEITTPGALDIDILCNNLDHVSDSFWQSALKNATPAEKKIWQQCLVDTLTSSHMMLVFVKD